MQHYRKDVKLAIEWPRMTPSLTKCKSEIHIFSFRYRGALFGKGNFALKSTKDDIIRMLEFLVDNIVVVFAEKFSNR